MILAGDEYALAQGDARGARNSISTPEKHLSMYCRSTIMTPPTAVELQEDRLLKKTGVSHEPTPGGFPSQGKCVTASAIAHLRGFGNLGPAKVRGHFHS